MMGRGRFADGARRGADLDRGGEVSFHMLQIGDTVIVPDPTSKDAWLYGDFLARVSKFRGDGDAIVVDQEDNAWQVECYRLKVVDETRETGIAGRDEVARVQKKIDIGGKVFYQGKMWRVVGVTGAGGEGTVELEPCSDRVLARVSDILPMGEGATSASVKAH